MAYTDPTPPDTQPTHTAPDGTTTLPNHIGGRTGVPAYDDTWEGWVGNYNVISDPSTEYPTRMQVTGPDIETESRDEVTGTTTVVYDVDWTPDPLEISL